MKGAKKTRDRSQIDDKAINETVRKILSDVARVDIADVRSSTDLREDLGIDSLNAMEILAAIEIKFKITINEAKAFEIITVDDLIETIKGYLKEKNKK